MKENGEILVPTKRKAGGSAAKRGCLSVRRVLGACLLAVVTLSLLGCLAYVLPEYYHRSSLVSARMQQVAGDHYHRLYGAPLVVRPGFRVERGRLYQRLYDVGYQLNDHSSTQLSFTVSEDRIRLFAGPDEKQPSYELEIGEGTVRRIIRSEDGANMTELRVGRPLLTSFVENIWEIRQDISVDLFPTELTEAVLSAEDGSFYRHPGIDIFAVTRAALINLREGSIKQGGSTITQQLVKTLSGRQERTFREKFYEVLIALRIELQYSKEQILDAYLNNIYMGHVGSYELRGLGAASYYLLGKCVTELSPGECAVLASMIKSPNGLSPLEKTDKAIVSGARVLRLMKKRGCLDDGYHYTADPQMTDAGGWQRGLLMSMSWAWQQAEKELQAGGIVFPATEQAVVELSIDHLMQKDISDRLQQHLERLEDASDTRIELEAAAVAIEQETGAVRALVGGRDFSRNQFNRATMAQRPIGSLVKPFVYLTAMGSGTEGGPITPQMRVLDSPLKLTTSSGPWRPQNYDRTYHGAITVEQALVRSRNIPAVRIGRRAGLERVSEMIKRSGISDEPVPYPSLFLGACPSNVVRMASAYGALANDGRYVGPQLLDRALIGGSVVFLRRPEMQPVFNEYHSRVMTEMLQKVFVLGTGRSIWKYPVDGEIAGKTGTSNNTRDSWFAGYTPNLTAAVWVGNDDNNSIGLTGAEAALPLWAEIAGRFGQDYEARFKSSSSLVRFESGTGQQKQPVDHLTIGSKKRLAGAQAIPAQVYGSSATRQIPSGHVVSRDDRVGKVEASSTQGGQPQRRSVETALVQPDGSGAVIYNHSLAKKQPLKSQRYRYFNR